MHNHNPPESEQEVWYLLLWHRFTDSRVPIAGSVAAMVAFFMAAGQPDAWRWFLMTFMVTTPGLLLIIWLLGEVVVAAIIFVEEWRDVLTSTR